MRGAWFTFGVMVLLCGTMTTGRAQVPVQPSLMDEAFQAAQWGFLSSAGSALRQTQQRRAVGDGPLADLLKARQLLVDQISKTETLLASTGTDKTGEARDAKVRLAGDLEGLNAELRDLDTNLDQNFPEFSRLTNPHPLSLGQVQALLAPDEGMLFVFSGQQNSFVWAITPTRIAWHRVGLGRVTLADSVGQIRQSLQQAVLLRGAAGLDDEFGKPKTAAFDRVWSGLLYGELLRPLEPTLKDVKHLYSVVDGPLTGLPLSLLVTDWPLTGEDDDPEVLRRTSWLFQKHAMTTLPSVESLQLIVQRRSEPTVKEDYAFLGFGDPDFSGQEMSQPSGSLYRAGTADLESIRALAPLPNTRREIRQLSAILGPETSQIYLGSQASEATLRQALPVRAKVIAFATHGLLSGELRGLAEPALVLSPPDLATPANDGLLKASEIAELTIDADWIVLSACNTAGGDGTPDAEGLSGLTRAFLFSGARTIMVSHWPVRDDAAARLTTQTFGYLADTGGGAPRRKAEALQHSMQLMLDDTSDPSLAHPAAWAPFVVVGDGGY